MLTLESILGKEVKKQSFKFIKKYVFILDRRAYYGSDNAERKNRYG
jgi:hypothetical protein